MQIQLNCLDELMCEPLQGSVTAHDSGGRGNKVYFPALEIMMEIRSAHSRSSGALVPNLTAKL